MAVVISGTDDVSFGGGLVLRVKEIAGMTGNLTSSQKTHRKTYDVWALNGSFPSIVDCYTAVVLIAPSTFDSLALNGLDYREDEGTDHFLFNCNYDSTPPESTLRWSGDTTGGTVKLTASRNTSRFAPTGRTAPDFKGAIGIKQTDKNVEPEGVDVIIPGLQLTATYKWPKNTFGLAQAKALAGYTGKTNSVSWQTFAIGELLFMGASFEIVPDLPTEVQYKFVASQNVTGLTIGDITSIVKAGHDYLWVLFEASEDTGAKKLVQRPLGVYVERVYDSFDFNNLGF